MFIPVFVLAAECVFHCSTALHNLYYWFVLGPRIFFWGERQVLGHNLQWWCIPPISLPDGIQHLHLPTWLYCKYEKGVLCELNLMMLCEHAVHVTRLCLSNSVKRDVSWGTIISIGVEIISEVIFYIDLQNEWNRKNIGNFIMFHVFFLNLASFLCF